MGQSRSARVSPSGEPKGTYVGGRVRDLADQNGSCLIIKTIVVFVRVGIFPAKRVTVSQENRFEPAMRAEAAVKRMVGRIADEGRIVGTHGEKRRVAVYQRAPETVVDSRLAARVTIEIVGGAEGIMRLRDEVREEGRMEFGLLPFSRSKCFCKFLAVNADLPRQ